MSTGKPVSAMINSVETPPEIRLGYNGDLDGDRSQKVKECYETIVPGEADDTGRDHSLFARMPGEREGIKNNMSQQPQVNSNNNISAEEGGSSQPVSPAFSDVPLLTRINRLDIVLDYLDEQTLSGGSSTLPPTINGQSASLELDSLEQRCKPIRLVLEEAEAKGSIVDRIAALEDRVRKLKDKLERRSSSKQSIRINGRGGESGLHLHLKGSSGCDIYYVEEEEEENRLTPCERMQKGVHEQVSRRVLHVLDIPSNKDREEDGPLPYATTFPCDDVKKITVEEGEITASESKEKKTEHKNMNISTDEKKGKGKGKLRRMFGRCLCGHSHQAQ